MYLLWSKGLQKWMEMQETLFYLALSPSKRIPCYFTLLRKQIVHYAADGHSLHTSLCVKPLTTIMYFVLYQIVDILSIHYVLFCIVKMDGKSLTASPYCQVYRFFLTAPDVIYKVPNLLNTL